MYEPGGWGGVCKAIIFRAKAIFFGQKPAGKNEKNTFLYLLNNKNGIYSI